MSGKNESENAQDNHGDDAMRVTDSRHLHPLNLVDVLEDIARAFPDRVALFFSRTESSLTHTVEGCLTFVELEEEVSQLAAAFHARGIGKGDRVVVMIPMSRELYIVVLALMKLAATAVFIEPFMGLSQMVRHCQISEPKAFVAAPKGHLLRLFSKAFQRVPLKYVTSEVPLPGAETIESLLSDSVPRIKTERPDEETAALINFTSGSTGRSRAVNRTHNYLWAQHLALAKAFPFEPGDVDMSAFPIFPLHSLASGVPTILPAMFSGSPAKVVPEAVVRQIHDHRVTTIKGSPGFFEAIAKYCATQAVTLGTLRALLTGGAPVHPELIRSLKRLIPKGEVYIAYGSTEVEPISGISGSEILKETWDLTMHGRGNCVGAPLGTVEVRVIKCLDGPVDLERDGWDGIIQSKGMAGEVVVTGELARSTYFQDPQAVAETKFQDETGNIWHRTGDVGYLDESDRLWLLGRVSNRVLRADRELHPLQIEPVINALSFVERCALLGVPDAVLGQRAILIVTPKSRRPFQRLIHGKDWEAKIRELCRSQGFPIDEVRFKRTFPLDRRRHAKVDYEKLQAWYHRPAFLRFIT